MVASKTDLMYEILYNTSFVPLPSPKVNVKTSVVDGEPSYLMKNHATGMYYDLDELTNHIWNLVDGEGTVNEIKKEVQRLRPDVQEETIQETLLFFADSNMLIASLEPPPRKRFQVVSAFEIDICLVEHSNDFLQSLHNKIRPIFKDFLLWAVIAFIFIGFLLFAGEFVSIFGKKANFEILGSTVVGFFFYTFFALGPIIAIHEIAHGLTLVHYGGKPGEVGTGLFYFGPMFYTDTTDAWGLSRRDRIMVYLAGNITTLLIGSTLVVVMFIVTIPEPAHHILTITAFYCFTTALFNFAPPFETDGYYILSDIVNTPNLRRDSYAYLGSILKRALGRRSKKEKPDLDKRKKRILLGYAALSATWIVYIVFQSALFLVYMSQDVVIALAEIFQAVSSSQALSASMVVIAAASILYFGMQVVGYSFLFSEAIKKATTRPFRVEAIHDRDLAVLAYLPPQSPESLSNGLRAKMEKIAAKYSSNLETKQIGSSVATVLRMGGTRLALVQIKEQLKQVENEFCSAYQSFIRNHKKILQKLTIHAPDKMKLTIMFRQLAAESAAIGNSRARFLERLREEKQNENLLYLLSSVFGTVWTIEVHPEQGYQIQKELFPSLLLEDLTLTDLYKDTENFKKRVVYGFDSLARLATEIDSGVKESLARPEKYQLVSIFEPIKGRIIFVGRTEQIEKNIHAFAPLFVAQTWSGYLDQLLGEACFALSTLNRSSLPSAKELKKMSDGELAAMTRDLSAFMENKDLVDRCIRNSEARLVTANQTLKRLKKILKPAADFKIGSLDTVFNVNVEDLKRLPGRIKEFRKKWRALSRRIGKIQEHVEKEYTRRKPAIAKKTHRMLRIYAVIVTLSIIPFILIFQYPFAPWGVTFLSVVLLSHVAYWFVFYRRWRSSRTVTRYPSHTFNITHLFILTLTEAIYGYVTTEAILAPYRELQDEKALGL